MIIYSFRKYGQPKLQKPKELRGIKPAFSLDYISKRCKCQIFIESNNVWVKHRDYFSPPMKLEDSDLGKPLGYLAKKHLNKDRQRKFNYEDTWGSIVLRQEAWIKLEELLTDIKNKRFALDIRDDILRQQEELHGFEPYELCCTDMERFWEKLIFKLNFNYTEK